MQGTEPGLTERQQRILRLVVEKYVTTGEPVGSKALVERGGIDVSPSTVRNEFAALETLGLLTHPHTSAGRLPTERGYRLYAGSVLDRLEVRPGAFPLDLTTVRREVDAAFQATTEMLSRVTRLLALVSAPPLETTTVRRIEVLLLQPDVVMIVVITSTGGVTKHVVAFDHLVDPGLAAWAGEYLNDRVAGLTIGSGLLRNRLADPELAHRSASSSPLCGRRSAAPRRTSSVCTSAARPGSSRRSATRSTSRTEGSSRSSSSGRRCSRCSAGRSIHAARSCVSAPSSSFPSSRTSRSWAPRTGSRTGRSAP